MRRLLLASVLLAALVGAAVALGSGGAVPPVKLQAVELAAGALKGPDTVVLSPNGKTLYVGDVEQGVVAINLEHPSAAPVAITDAGEPLESGYGLALSPNGRVLYISAETGLSGDVYVADVGGSGASNDKVVAVVKDPHHLIHVPSALALTRDGKTLYISNLTQTSPSDATQVLIATVKHATSVTAVKAATKPRRGYGAGLVLSPNNKLLYSSNEVGNVAVFKVVGDSLKTAKSFHAASGVYGLAVSPDGRTLYGAAVSGALSGLGAAPSRLETFALSSSGLHASLRRTETLAAGSNVTGLTLSAGGRTGYAATVAYTGGPYIGGVSRFAIPPAASDARITGHDRAGSVLKVKVKSVPGATFTVRWLADGKAVKGATKTTLKITAKLAGKRISAKVTVDAAGYSPATLKAKA